MIFDWLFRLAVGGPKWLRRSMSDITCGVQYNFTDAQTDQSSMKTHTFSAVWLFDLRCSEKFLIYQTLCSTVTYPTLY